MRLGAHTRLGRPPSCQADASILCSWVPPPRLDGWSWAPRQTPSGHPPPRRRLPAPAQCAQTAMALWPAQQAADTMPAPADSRQPRELTRRIKCTRTPGEVAYLWQHQRHRFNQIHVCAALMRLAHITDLRNSGPESSHFIHELCQQASALTHLMGPREVSSIIWAVAALQHPAASSWVDHMAHAMLERLPHASGQDVGMTLWALARMGHHPGTDWLHSLTTHLQHRMHTLDTQALVNVMWALATLRYQPPAKWLNAYVHALHGRLHELTAQGHANTLWALARMGQPVSPAWVAHLTMRLSTDLNSFSMQELSMLVFALGRMHQPRTHTTPSNPATRHTFHPAAPTTTTTVSSPSLPPAVLQAVSAAAMQGMSELNASQAGCLMWGLAHMGHHPGQQLLDSFFTHTERLLSTADSQTLSHMALVLQRLLHLRPAPESQQQQQHGQQQHGQQQRRAWASATHNQPHSGSDSSSGGSTAPALPQNEQWVLYPPSQQQLHVEATHHWQAHQGQASTSTVSEGTQHSNAQQQGSAHSGSDAAGPSGCAPHSRDQAAEQQQGVGQKQSMVPPTWAHAYLAATERSLARMDARTCAMCAYALSQLGVQPGALWRAAFLTATHSHLTAGRLTAVEIMCVATALARWRTPLPAVWAVQFMRGFEASVVAGGGQPCHSSRTLLALARLQLLPKPETLAAIRWQFEQLADHVTATDVAVMRRAAALLPQLDMTWLDSSGTGVMAGTAAVADLSAATQRHA